MEEAVYPEGMAITDPECCPECGGSGVLNIEYTVDVETGERSDIPYVATCHACPVGQMWRSIEEGLDA